MSKKESSPKKDDKAPDLSALDFGPAWARKDQSKKPRKPAQGKPSHGGESGEKRAPQAGRRQSPQGRDGRNNRRDGRRDDRRGDHKKGSDRRDFKKDGRDRGRKPMAPPTEGVKARIMPIEEGMDAMAKQITATGRTHSVFELAWVVLGGLERFHCVFESEEQPLYRSNSDHSVWIYQKECLAHLWSSGLVNKYYDEEIAEIEAPKGNFQSVGRCGFSGQLIGPPNHHAYQQTLLNIHREKFSNMALDRYKSKIVMEHTEEAVQEWMDSMRKHKRWRPKTEKPVEEPVAEPEGEGESPEPAEATEAAEVKVPETVVPEADIQTETPATPSIAEPIIEETVVILDNHREVEQHFLSHGFEQEFESGKITSALANIPPHMISPGLMTLLKNTVAEEKRYPGNLASILCRQMSGRHLAVYKWKKRLHCGPARPKRVPDDMVMADRPSALFHWVISHPGGKIDTMWKECMPADVDDDAKHLWYHDLHWLINEGLVLLFSDGTLHAAKELEKKPAKKQAKKAKKKSKQKVAKKTAEVKGDVKDEAGDQPAEASKDAAPKEEAPKAEEADVASPQDAPISGTESDPDPVPPEKN